MLNCSLEGIIKFLPASLVLLSWFFFVEYSLTTNNCGAGEWGQRERWNVYSNEIKLFVSFVLKSTLSCRAKSFNIVSNIRSGQWKGQTPFYQEPVHPPIAERNYLGFFEKSQKKRLLTYFYFAHKPLIMVDWISFHSCKNTPVCLGVKLEVIKLLGERLLHQSPSTSNYVDSLS